MEYIWAEPIAEQNASTSICDVDQGIRNMGNNPDLFRKHFNKFKANSARSCGSLTSTSATAIIPSASIPLSLYQRAVGNAGTYDASSAHERRGVFFHELAQQLEHAPDALIHAHKHVQKITHQLVIDLGQVCETEF